MSTIELDESAFLEFQQNIALPAMAILQQEIAKLKSERLHIFEHFEQEFYTLKWYDPDKWLSNSSEYAREAAKYDPRYWGCNREIEHIQWLIVTKVEPLAKVEIAAPLSSRARFPAVTIPLTVYDALTKLVADQINVWAAMAAIGSP